MPGSTYNNTYCDIPVKSSRSSYVSRALDAGFSTFGIDRLATGRSTLPPSSRYTLDSGTEAIHQVVTRLRGGGIRNGTFDKIVRVGHSLGSSMAWARAEKHDGDIDAFVLTGMSHVVRDEDPSGGGPAEDVAFETRAVDDPKFRGRINDPGYWTTNAGMRQFFYYAPATDPAVIEADERFKDVSTAADSEGANLPPAQPVPFHQSADPPMRGRTTPNGPTSRPSSCPTVATTCSCTRTHPGRTRRSSSGSGTRCPGPRPYLRCIACSPHCAWSNAVYC
ncbi:alpha/beta fold hydrolase [Streptomyces olivaceus]